MKTWIDTQYFTELEIIKLAYEEQKRITEKITAKYCKMTSNDKNYEKVRIKYITENTKLDYLSWKIKSMKKEK